MKRVVIRLGNIFCAKIDNSFKMYFQYIGDDLTQLNSRVIRVFKTRYPLDYVPDLEEIVKDEIFFYTHVVIRWGIQMNLWEKVGNVPFKETVDVLFRRTSDYGVKAGDEPVKISENWSVWRINEPFRFVGKLEGENRDAEIGVVWAPDCVISRMRTGSYEASYPGFE